MALTKSDIKILNRLKITTEERSLVEDVWNIEPNDSRVIPELSGYMFNLVILAAMIARFYTARAQPFVDIGIVLLWVWCSIYSILLLILFVLAIPFAADRDKNILQRVYMRFLPGGYSSAARYLGTFVSFSTFCAMAALGYHFTAAFYLVVFLFVMISRSLITNIVKNTLKEIVQNSRMVVQPEFVDGEFKA